MKKAPQHSGKPAAEASYIGENLVFLISQPKAGSTLLQRLLAGHPDIQTSAETWLMLHPVYGTRLRGIHADFNSSWAAKGVREFLDYYADGEETYREGVRSFAKTIYGRVLEKSGKRYFLDKTPRYTLIVEELYELFPAAKYILLVRNPLAILNSELNTYVKGDWPVLASFRPDLVRAPKQLLKARDLLADKAFEIRYEELVTDPASSVEALCAYLGIDYVPSMLDYSDTPAPKGRMNDPVGIHRHTRPSTESLEKWRAMADDPQLRHFALEYIDEIGDATIDALGYDSVSMREAFRAAQGKKAARAIYPWKLAITSQSRWGLRQHMQHAYLVKAQQGSVLGGVAAAIKVLFSRIASGTARLTGSPSAPAGDAAASGNEEPGSVSK